MTRLEIHQYAYNSDNYGVLIHDPESGDTAAVDAGDSKACLGALKSKGWNLSQIWITHHHWDHTDGLLELKAATGAKVFGPAPKVKAIDGLDVQLGESGSIDFAGRTVIILETPGHTLDMINFYLADEGLLFAGDTLFVLGCGRILEGDPAMMWNSLEKLARLPVNTVIYCSHEYSVANAKFALSIDPENEVLEARAVEIAEVRDRGAPSVPTTLEMELATNPFLRAGDRQIRARLGMQNDSDEAVFSEIRRRKDNF